MSLPDPAAQRPSIASRWAAWLQALRPAALAVDAAERRRAVLSAFVGILFTGLVCSLLGPADPALPWLVAPLGASAVLVYAVPASPLAQPWSVVGGNTVSALVGLACVQVLGSSAWAAALAVAGAIGAMFALRCLHPPGGAMALLVVLTHVGSWRFALFPAFVNSVLLVGAGMVLNPLGGRRYPHRQVAPTPAPDGSSRGPSRFSAADLDAALAHYNQVLDVSRDDLQALLSHAEAAAWQRQLGELRCADIMSPEPVSVEFGTALADAWALLRQRRIKALPVVDRTHRLVGILTLADFMRHAELDGHEGLGGKLRAFVARSGLTHSDRPEVVGQIMTRQVRVASADRLVMELVPLFTEAGHHHIPIVGEDRRLVGIITQSDFVRALYRAVGS